MRGLLPESRGDFIPYWDLAIDIFREQEERADRRDRQARRLEGRATRPTLPDFVAAERARSPELGGRSVFGWAAAVG